MSEQCVRTIDCAQLRKLLINALAKSGAYINCSWYFVSLRSNGSSLRISMGRKTGVSACLQNCVQLRKLLLNALAKSDFHINCSWYFASLRCSGSSLRSFVIVEIISLQKSANSENFRKWDYHAKNWGLRRVRKFAWR